MASCLQDPKCLSYDVLAIQKSWVNLYSFITHHFIKRNFHLIYPDLHEVNGATVRMCFFVNNRIPLIDIETRYVSDDLIILQIRINSDANNPHAGNHYLQIHNIYNKPAIDPCTVLSELQTVLREEGGFGINDPFSSLQHLIVGDFNIHHVGWKGVNAINDPRASELFILIDEFGLIFNTSKRTKTYVSRTGNEFTIDLSFATEELSQRVIFCMAREDLNHDSDHLFIETILDISISIAPSAEKFCWDRTDTTKLNGTLNQKLSDIPAAKSISSLDLFIIQVSEAIYAAIIDSTPKSLTGARATSGFNDQCKDVRSHANQARRKLQKALRAGDQEAIPELLKKKRRAMKRKKKLIRGALRKTHRDNLEETTGDAQKTWRLAKWARNRSILFKPSTPFFKKRDGITALTKRNKVQCLIEEFFPPPAATVLNDLADDIDYPESVDLPRISEREIQQAIENTASNKALGNDNIPNVILKRALQRILSALSWIYNTSLKLGYCPTHFRNSITVFLRKIDKSDYVILKSFRPIALLNTIGKVMESIIATRLSYAAEIFNLLPEDHFEGRKCFSPEQALHYIIEKIHSAWTDKKIVSMLTLDVIGAFPNVFQPRLFHNLRKRRISGSTLQWIESFLADRHTVLRLVDITTERVRTPIGLFQGSSMSPIFYLFYNADLIEFFVDSSRGILVSGFINDVVIIAVNDSAEKNLITLTSAHERATEWATSHGSVFASAKYELIHFRRLPFEGSKLLL